jgi:hypothetical protein
MGGVKIKRKQGRNAKSSSVSSYVDRRALEKSGADVARLPHRCLRPNPSFPLFSKGRNSYLWQRGPEGDFERKCLINYGPLGMFRQDWREDE